MIRFLLTLCLSVQSLPQMRWDMSCKIFSFSLKFPDSTFSQTFSSEPLTNKNGQIQTANSLISLSIHDKILIRVERNQREYKKLYVIDGPELRKWKVVLENAYEQIFLRIIRINIGGIFNQL